MHLLVILLQHLVGLLLGASQAPQAQAVPVEMPEISGAQPAASQASQMSQALQLSQSSRFSESRWMTIGFEEVWRFGGWALPGRTTQHSPVQLHRERQHYARERAVLWQLAASQAATAWRNALGCCSAGLDHLAWPFSGEFSRRASAVAGRFAALYEVESPQIPGSGSSGH